MSSEFDPPLSVDAINQIAIEILLEAESNSGDYLESIRSAFSYIPKKQHARFIESLGSYLEKSSDPEILVVKMLITVEFPIFSRFLK